MLVEKIPNVFEGIVFLTSSEKTVPIFTKGVFGTNEGYAVWFTI